MFAEFGTKDNNQPIVRVGEETRCRTPAISTHGWRKLATIPLSVAAEVERARFRALERINLTLG